MSKVRFYRVESLPETGIVGGLYFVYGEGRHSLYLCTETSTFEFYGTDLTECMNKVSELEMATAGSINTLSERIEENKQVTSAALNLLNDNKQDKEDNTLLTSDKTVIGAINEIKQIVDITIPLLQASL